MENYKEDIVSTRVGCLGSSDGNLLSQIAYLGRVTKSAYKRLAVVKGLIPHQEIPETAAIKAGNEMEMAIYNHLRETDSHWESNERWESKKYSNKNCKLISHPDITKTDFSTKTIYVVEVKTTKYSVAQTRETYKAQLYIHFLLARERAKEMGKDWKVKVLLAHYSTDGLDLSMPIEFEPKRLTIKPIAFHSPLFDVEKAMMIVDSFLEDFTEYYEGEEIDAALLPTTVQSQFENVATMLAEIKERELKVSEFKQRLYEFMLDKGIKSIKGDMFSIVRVDETTSQTFDYKRYIDDMMAKYPRKTKKMVAEYTKETKRKGYCNIKVNNKTNND